jgi:hypothetical protein
MLLREVHSTSRGLSSSTAGESCGRAPLRMTSSTGGHSLPMTRPPDGGVRIEQRILLSGWTEKRRSRGSRFCLI